MSEVDRLVSKIVKGEVITSKKDLQLYKNHSEEVESRLKQAWKEYNRRVSAL